MRRNHLKQAHTCQGTQKGKNYCMCLGVSQYYFILLNLTSKITNYKNRTEGNVYIQLYRKLVCMHNYQTTGITLCWDNLIHNY